MRRQVGIPAIYQGKPLPLGFRADILADETVILEIKAVPALLPAHGTNRPMMTRPSSRAVGMRTGLVGRRAKTQLQLIRASTAGCALRYKGDISTLG